MSSVRPRVPRRLALIAVAALLVAPGCGGDEGGEGGDAGAAEPAAITELRFPRGSSVGDGLGGPVTIAQSLRAAARTAGCTVTSTRSAGNDHVDEATYEPPLPPTSGPHDEIPASWGVYDEPVPYPHEVHSLEHGGVAIHLGEGLPDTARDDVVALWREAPPYVLVVPAMPGAAAPQGVTVTSWQRAMRCPAYTPQVREAIEVYRDLYRGRGPEDIQALNPPDGEDPEPAPAMADRRVVR